MSLLMDSDPGQHADANQHSAPVIDGIAASAAPKTCCHAAWQVLLQQLAWGEATLPEKQEKRLEVLHEHGGVDKETLQREPLFCMETCLKVLDLQPCTLGGTLLGNRLAAAALLCASSLAGHWLRRLAEGYDFAIALRATGISILLSCVSLGGELRRRCCFCGSGRGRGQPQ